MAGVAYQASIHKAFVNEVLEVENKEKFAKVIKENPEVAGIISFQQSEEAKIILSGNFAICKWLYLADETSKAHDFANKDERNKTVAQTVRANVSAYNNVVSALENESDEAYKAVYKKLKLAFEDYFSITAENGLSEYYGDKYTKLADKITSKKKKAKAEKQKAKEEEKANQ